MRYRWNIIFICCPLLFSILICDLYISKTYGSDISFYELTEESNYQEGCFAPCMCPIFLVPNIQGNFLLRILSQADELTHYEVLEVEWYMSYGGESVHIIGSGYYQICLDKHRMELDLKVGNSPIQHFDSGLVPYEYEFPNISLAVALNGFYCYDQVFDISAVPVLVGFDQSTWGRLKAMFR